MTIPYYQDESVTIYHGDCREVLPGVFVDLIVTDPPFGIADAPIQGERRAGKRIGNVNTWHPETTWDGFIDPEWPALCAAAAPVVAWFGHWRKRTEVEAVLSHPIRCEIVWSKDTHVGPPCPAAMRDERIWIFSAGGLKPMRFETTVWDEPVIPTWSHKRHKNEKPLQLMRRLVSWLPGETVLDPFMGSGSTLRAAKDLGRRAIGIEIEERYCEIAAKRMEQGALPFTERPAPAEQVDLFEEASA